MFKKVLCSICVLSLGLASPAFSAILLDKVMAVVNKEVITWSDLYRAMEFEAADGVKAMKEEDKRRFFKESEPVFLENLIDKKLLLQEAENAGIKAVDDEVNSAVKGIMKKYSMTEEVFREAIKREGFTLAQYKRNLAEQITIGRIVDHDVKNKVLVTEGEVNKYLSEHKGIEKENEGYDISHIFLRQTENKKQVEDRARDIYKKIEKGASFSDLAQQLSEDSSARLGGNLGFIKKSDLTKDFLSILSRMKKDEVCEPFWGERGMHILKLNDILVFKDQNELREAIRQKLLEEKFNTEYKNWIKGLREKAYVEIRL